MKKIILRRFDLIISSKVKFWIVKISSNRTYTFFAYILNLQTDRS